MIVSAERKEEFLREYAALCRRLGMMIEACGCCQSPWIEPVETAEELDQHVLHLRQQAGLTTPLTAPAQAEPTALDTTQRGSFGYPRFDELKESVNEEELHKRMKEVAEGLRPAYEGNSDA
jgi:hypothetical protein